MSRLARAVTALPAEALVLEITETCIISDYERSRKVIEDLRDLGLVVSIDDFGAGFTSLAYLGDLAVGELKLDRIFVTGLASEDRSRDRALIRSTIELGSRSTAARRGRRASRTARRSTFSRISAATSPRATSSEGRCLPRNSTFELVARSAGQSGSRSAEQRVSGRQLLFICFWMTGQRERCYRHDCRDESEVGTEAPPDAEVVTDARDVDPLYPLKRKPNKTITKITPVPTRSAWSSVMGRCEGHRRESGLQHQECDHGQAEDERDPEVAVERETIRGIAGGADSETCCTTQSPRGGTARSRTMRVAIPVMRSSRDNLLMLKANAGMPATRPQPELPPPASEHPRPGERRSLPGEPPPPVTPHSSGRHWHRPEFRDHTGNSSFQFSVLSPAKTRAPALAQKHYPWLTSVRWDPRLLDCRCHFAAKPTAGRASN